MPDLFPLTPAPRYGTAISPDWAELVRRGPTGIVQVRRRRLTPLWGLNLHYETTPDRLSAIEDFLHGLQGAYTTCYMYTPSPWQRWPRWTIGTGNGSHKTFLFGATSIQPGSYQVWVNNSLQTEGTHYTLAAAPDDSFARWRVVFVAAPGNGHAVEIAFRGRRVLLGRVMEWDGPSPPAYNRSALHVRFEGEPTDDLNVRSA